MRPDEAPMRLTNGKRTLERQRPNIGPMHAPNSLDPTEISDPRSWQRKARPVAAKPYKTDNPLVMLVSFFLEMLRKHLKIFISSHVTAARLLKAESRLLNAPENRQAMNRPEKCRRQT